MIRTPTLQVIASVRSIPDAAFDDHQQATNNDPKEVCDALDVGPGDQITWEVNGGRVAVTTERPGLWRWKGFIKHGPDDAVKAVHEARKTRRRI